MKLAGPLSLSCRGTPEVAQDARHQPLEQARGDPPRCQRSTLAWVSAFTAEDDAPGRCGPRTREGKRKTRDHAAVRRASPRIVTVWRKREVTMEATRALTGPRIEVVDYAPDMRRCSIVKAGL
jgi:hypothetical protein